MRYKLSINLFLFVLLLSCVHRQDIVEKGDTPSHSFNKPEFFEKTEDSELSSIDIGVDPGESVMESNGIFKIKYTVKMAVKYGNVVKCRFYNEYGDEIFVSDAVLVDKNGTAIVYFYDYFLYKEIKYKLEISSTAKSVAVFEGTTVREDYPGIKSCLFGPVVSKMTDSGRETDLLVECICTSFNTKPEYVRVIPPTEDFFWDLPVTDMSDDEYSFSGKINYSIHKDYIDNGNYILQVSFGKWGLVQRVINITDIYGNTKGPNYGFTIPKEKKTDKDTINFDIPELEDISSIDLVLYIKNGTGDYLNIGGVCLPFVADTIKKSDITKYARDIYGDSLKLKNNKEYYYQIVIKSKEKNTIRYLSSSEKYRIVFYGFSLF